MVWGVIMLYKLRYNENEDGTIKNENGTIKMRTLQCNTVQYLPKWDPVVGDYATHRGISMRKTENWFQLLLNHIYFINSLRPTDVIWRYRCGSTLTQVMAWWLTAPSHYPNQCWLLISEVLWHSSESNSTARAQAIILHNELESYILKITFISLLGHCVITFSTENKT